MFKAIGVAFFFTFLGKILAFFRIQQIAINFTSDYWLDAYFMVFSFTSVFDSILITGAIGAVFVPKYLKNRSISEEIAQEFYEAIFSSLIIVFFIIAIVLYLYSNALASLLVRDDNKELIYAISELLKTFCLFPLMTVLFQLPTLYNQANQKFKLSTLNPILLNSTQLFLILIITFYGESSQKAVHYLLIVYILTMGLCVVVQTQFNKSAQLRLSTRVQFKELKIVSGSLVAVICFIAMEELNLLIDQYFATGLSEGSVTNLLYANRLVKIFGSVFVASVITVFYPKISNLIVSGKWFRARYVAFLIVELLCFVTIPLVVMFIVFSNEITSLLYGGQVSNDVPETLRVYSALIITGSIYMIQLRLAYSIGVNSYLISSCVVAVIGNFYFNFLLVDVFGLKGIAISTVLISILQVIVFEIFLRTKNVVLLSPNLLFRMIFYTAIAVFSFLLILRVMPSLYSDYWQIGMFVFFTTYFVPLGFIRRKMLFRILKL